MKELVPVRFVPEAVINLLPARLSRLLSCTLLAVHSLFRALMLMAFIRFRMEDIHYVALGEKDESAQPTEEVEEGNARSDDARSDDERSNVARSDDARSEVGRRPGRRRLRSPPLR